MKPSGGTTLVDSITCLISGIGFRKRKNILVPCTVFQIFMKAYGGFDAQILIIQVVDNEIASTFFHGFSKYLKT